MDKAKSDEAAKRRSDEGKQLLRTAGSGKNGRSFPFVAVSLLRFVASQVRYPLSIAFACTMLAGCADSNTPTTQPAQLTADQRQSAALADPMNVGNTDKFDITGGGIGHYDKGAMKHDVNSVLSP